MFDHLAPVRRDNLKRHPAVISLVLSKPADSIALNIGAHHLQNCTQALMLPNC